MNPDDIRRWASNMRAAQAREREESRQGLGEPLSAVAAALALVRLMGNLHGWPIPEDAVSRREDRLAYGHWTLLRQASDTQDR